MICAHCDEPIRRDELSRRINRHAGTGAGAVEYVHVRPCLPPSLESSVVRRRMAGLMPMAMVWLFSLARA